MLNVVAKGVYSYQQLLKNKATLRIEAGLKWHYNVIFWLKIKKISFNLKRRLSQIKILFLNQQKRCIHINAKKIISSEIYKLKKILNVCVNKFGVYVTFDGQ